MNIVKVANYATDTKQKGKDDWKHKWQAILN